MRFVLAAWIIPRCFLFYFPLLSTPSALFSKPQPVFATSATNAAVTLGEALAFRFDSLLSAGYPDPTYELVDPSAPCDTFDSATGELHFAPDAPGTYTFTCNASNANCSATCTLAVTATVPFLGVPSGVAFTDIVTDAFTVTWSNVPYADSYRIDVLEGNSFDPFVAPPVLEEHFDTRDIPAGWDINTGVGSSIDASASPSPPPLRNRPRLAGRSPCRPPLPGLRLPAALSPSPPPPLRVSA